MSNEGVADRTAADSAAAVLPEDSQPAGLRERIHCIGPCDEGTPLLIVIVGLHGNEPAGVAAADRLRSRLTDQPDGLLGQLAIVVGNRKALTGGRRFVDEDLNRVWLQERLEALGDGNAPLTDEEQELRELHELLEGLIRDGSQRRRYMVDLHTFSSAGPPFALLDHRLANRDFAFEFPVPLILGLGEQIRGTLLDYFEDAPVTGLGFESGQHDDPVAVDHCEAALWIALEASGLVARGLWPEVAVGRRLLAAATSGLGRVYDVRYRRPVGPQDGFRMKPGFSGFQPVAEGEVLARDDSGPIAAGESGLVVMPLYQAQGEDGFFLVRPVRRLWLEVSRLVRKLRLQEYLHLLPGIRRVRGQPGSYRVGRRAARWYALELLHLLGFRRRRHDGDRLIVQRRDDGVESR